MNVERTCARCGVDITHRDKRSRHCSPLCRDRDWVKSVIGTVRNCLHCGASFSPSKNPHVYCSKQCRDRSDLDRNRSDYNRRNAARRALDRTARAEGESFTHDEVFDRDGWICQLCFAPIDWRIFGRDPAAPALDHILPLSKGGTHRLDNVWASHFGCNARKRDRDDVVILPPPVRR